jgi:hypothetical protein
MATVRDVVLHVDEDDEQGRRPLSVSYTVGFETWERDAWFSIEIIVSGLGDDGPIEIARLAGQPFKASSRLKGEDGSTFSQTSPKAPIDSAALDVRPTILLYPFLYLRLDPVWAIVRVVPVEPQPGEAMSPVMAAEFELTG